MSINRSIPSPRARQIKVNAKCHSRSSNSNHKFHVPRFQPLGLLHFRQNKISKVSSHIAFHVTAIVNSEAKRGRLERLERSHPYSRRLNDDCSISTKKMVISWGLVFTKKIRGEIYFSFRVENL